jgi:hypothetical protein
VKTHADQTRDQYVRGPIDEGSPEPLHRCWVEPDWRDRMRVPQALIHGVLEAAPDPAIERQHKPAFGPLV